MLKQPLVIATTAAALALAGISTQAAAADPLAGALIGGGIGAAIGHSADGHHGAAVGGVLGAIVGSAIAADSGPYYYDRGYYDGGYYAPAPRAYYAPAPVYVEPAPVYYGPSVVYSYGPSYRSHWREREWRRHEWREHHRHW